MPPLYYLDSWAIRPPHENRVPHPQLHHIFTIFTILSMIETIYIIFRTITTIFVIFSMITTIFTIFSMNIITIFASLA